MRGVSLDMQIECNCGEFLSAQKNMSGMTLLKELKVKCKHCGTGFFLHIQEVKKLLAVTFPDTV